MAMHCELRVAPRDVPLPSVDLPRAGIQELVLAGGCFWCVEAVFERLDGVLDVESGYAGGSAATADYRQVCSGSTDHAEVVRIRYDSARISAGELLRVFFAVAHDPTQLDRQGNDRGRQYRSAVFYADEAQRALAERYIRELGAAGVFDRPVVTRLEPLQAFYPAEAYHQDYARANPGQPYIAMVALPKVATLEQEFATQLRKE